MLQTGFSQIIKTVGISYTNGTPIYTPAKAGSALALDTVTWRYYTWNGTTWISDGFRVQTICGCSAPAYTPTKFQSLVVINACNDAQGGPEIYKWSGSVWEKSGGVEYTAGAGISIDGSNIITNTAILAEPEKQLVIGNGTGATSSPRLTFDATNKSLQIKTDFNSIQPNILLTTDTTLASTSQVLLNMVNAQGMSKRAWTDARRGNFANYYDYISWNNSINAPKDSVGNMIKNRGFNFTGFPNYNPKRPTVYESIEQAFLPPGEVKMDWEWHVEARDTLGRFYRPYTMAYRYDGSGGGLAITSDYRKYFKLPGYTGEGYWETADFLTGTEQKNYKWNLKINNRTTSYAIIEKLSQNNNIYRNVLGSLPNNVVFVGDSAGIRINNLIHFQSNSATQRFTSSTGSLMFDSIEFTVKSTTDRGVNLTKVGVAGEVAMGYNGNGFLLGNLAITEQVFIHKTAPNYTIYANSSGKVGINNNGPGVGTLDVVQRSNDFLGGIGLRSTGNNYGVFYRDNSNNMFLTTNANTEFSFLSGGTFCAYGKAVVGATSPATSAALTVTSTTGGLLPPRMTTAQRDAIASPATGLTLYCTDCTATDASTGVMQTYNGATWKNNW